MIERVEKAGGEIFALDHGKLTHGTAATRLSTNMMGAVFQYFAEVTGEKVTAGQARAVAQGVYPHPRFPPGLVRGADGVLAPDPDVAPVVVAAFTRGPRRHATRGAVVPGRERDRAHDRWRAEDAELASVPRRGPLR